MDDNKMNDSQICIGNKGFKCYLTACIEQLKKTPTIEILSRGNMNSKAIHLAGCLKEEEKHNISDIKISRKEDNGGIVTELKIIIERQ